MSNLRVRRSRTAAAALALGALAASGLQQADAARPVHLAGSFTPWFSEDPSLNHPAAAPQDDEVAARTPTASSIAVLPDGDVVYWTGFPNTERSAGPVPVAIPEDQTSKSRRLDLSGYFATGSTASLTWRTPSPEDGGGGDLFCADQRVLADGTVLVVGGTSWVNEDESLTRDTPLAPYGRTEMYGLRSARAYDPTGNAPGGTWTQRAAMKWRRWYPALITLADGRLMVAGGVERLFYNTSLTGGDAAPGHPLPHNVRESEIYDPSADAWTPNRDSVSLPLFPRLHLMPNGKVLYPATGQTWSPFGEDRDQHEWGTLRWFDPATRTWSTPPVAGSSAHLGHRGAVSSVMLPLQPPYDQARILVSGGTLGPAPGSVAVTPLSEILTVDAAGVRRDLGPSMNHARWFGSGVALPTGEVVVLGGSDRDHAGGFGVDRAVRRAEMFDGERWVELALGGRDRTYHNTAILLKDGSILVGGHAPISSHDPSTAPGHGNNFKDPTFEIYRPPYLFRGARPRITGGVPAATSYGATMSVSFTAGAPPAAGSEVSVVLSRLPSATHVTDADQRTVVLPTLSRSDGPAGGTVTVEVPDNGAVLPPGYYYAFVVRTNAGQSKPTISTGEIVRIS